MQFETILYEKKEGVAFLTLNRPERLNAINTTMSRELPAAWDEIKKDPEVRVVILTGAGERALCTGYDVQDVARGKSDVGDSKDQGTVQSLKFTAIQNECWKPVITAVNGMVTGGGLHFIADSDLIVATEEATFFDNHVRVGLVAAQEPIGLIRRMPMEAVLRMAFLGGRERMSAQRAYELGLVGDVVPRERLLPRAVELAQMIMENSPAALAATKRAIWQSLNYGLEQALEKGWSVITEHAGHPDGTEGAKAFSERRKPKWRPPSL